jgi:hypothetical protein
VSSFRLSSSTGFASAFRTSRTCCRVGCVRGDMVGGRRVKEARNTILCKQYSEQAEEDMLGEMFRCGWKSSGQPRVANHQRKTTQFAPLLLGLLRYIVPPNITSHRARISRPFRSTNPSIVPDSLTFHRSSFMFSRPTVHAPLITHLKPVNDGRTWSLYRVVLT